ncbi:MAG: alpha-amylase family glycosyl hydrolase [Geobacteraceae bacterium]|nr:alpha-amylase family glycosyl hydrolase [Geobacteraceae bacterium]
MTELSSTPLYFPHTIQIGAQHWRSLDLGTLSRQITDHSIPDIIFYRQLSLRINRRRPAGSPFVHAGQLNMYATLLKVYYHLIEVMAAEQVPDVLLDALKRSGHDPEDAVTARTIDIFVEHFPPGGLPPVEGQQWLHASTTGSSRRREVLRELLLLRLAAENPALDNFREILDDQQLAASAPAYPQLAADMELALSRSPLLPGLEMTLAAALRAPILASPDSLSGQVGFIREQWSTLLPAELLEELLVSFDILLEEEREWGGAGEPGPPPVLEFGRADRAGGGGAAAGHAGGSSIFGGYEYPEYEHFSTDADWMSNVVLMAKMVYVWLHQLSKQYALPITRLDQIPDAELDRLAGRGFTGLWLIGIWERSPASQHIKQLCGNPEAIASAYSLYDYEIAADLGGWAALHNLKTRAAQRGVRLASDMVPNHTGIYSRWVMQHPDWFVQTDYPPFPTYQFNGEDLSCSADVVIQVEDGYWTKTDAAVVFRLIQRDTGRIRYIYHGNDGTTIPWNDTAQLNYLIPEVREAVIQTILHVARSFPIIRFDAAMTLAKKHFQRLWFPVRGLGGGIPSRAGHGMSREEFDAVFPTEFWREVVDRVALEAPGTLLLAEAFWLMEGYFVRTLGMHRVYNSAFMNMLKQEENAKYRQTIKNVLEFNPEILKRFVNFMNNPDEKTAVEQFGREGKYFGACVLLATMPGLPMFGHGQIEGYHEKYGMEYKQAYWNEEPDGHLIWRHEQNIFPLLRCRGLFSGSENFMLYDFFAGDTVNEDVFAYSNRLGEQRGLVLYHNRYATTAGWVRESVAYATKGNGDDPELRHSTLSAALHLVDDSQVYYSFRDHTLGQVFLRNSRELSEKGLYAELGEYEFHVFTDFCEIREDAEGSWGRLCEALNGRGVSNLNDERTQLQHAELNAAFRAVLEQSPGAIDRPAAFTKSLGPAVRRFLTVLGVTAVNQRAVMAEIAVCLSFLTMLKTVKPTAKAARKMLRRTTELLGIPGGAQLLLAWLLLKDRPMGLVRYGLDYSLKQSAGFDSLSAGYRAALLFQVLLASEMVNRHDLAAQVESSLATAAGREFLQVHESGGVEWFNKERYEELLEWFSIITFIACAADNPSGRSIATRLGRLAAENTRLIELAILAGYRTTLLLRLLRPDEKTAGARHVIKPARKKTEAQGSVRAQSPKIPDTKISR